MSKCRNVVSCGGIMAFQTSFPCHVQLQSKYRVVVFVVQHTTAYCFCMFSFNLLACSPSLKVLAVFLATGGWANAFVLSPCHSLPQALQTRPFLNSRIAMATNPTSATAATCQKEGAVPGVGDIADKYESFLIGEVQRYTRGSAHAPLLAIHGCILQGQ